MRDERDRLPVAGEGEPKCGAPSPLGYRCLGPVGHAGVHRFYRDGHDWAEWSIPPVVPLPHRRAWLRLVLVVLALWVLAAVLLVVVGRRP